MAGDREQRRQRAPCIPAERRHGTSVLRFGERHGTRITEGYRAQSRARNGLVQGRVRLGCLGCAACYRQWCGSCFTAGESGPDRGSRAWIELRGPWDRIWRVSCDLAAVGASRRSTLNGRARQKGFALVHKLHLCCAGSTACRLVLDPALRDPLNTSEQKADRRLGNEEATTANPAKAGDAKPRGYGRSAMRRNCYARRAAGWLLNYRGILP